MGCIQYTLPVLHITNICLIRKFSNPTTSNCLITVFATKCVLIAQNIFLLLEYFQTMGHQFHILSDHQPSQK